MTYFYLLKLPYCHGLLNPVLLYYTPPILTDSAIYVLYLFESMAWVMENTSWCLSKLGASERRERKRISSRRRRFSASSGEIAGTPARTPANLN